MKKSIETLGLLVLVSCFCGVVQARTWEVRVDRSGDAPTIQAAIDSAAAGDLVLVAPGRYTWTNQGTGNDYGLIRFLRGKNNFTVRGQGGAGATILDAEAQGRVMYFQGYNTVTVEGFTITGGVATATGYYSGGGIVAHLAPPVVKECIITGNSAQSGGGLWCGGWSTMRVENCEFSWNTSYRGGAISYVNSATTCEIVDCLIKNNTATSHGGAVFVYSSAVSIENTVFAYNSAANEGGAFNLQEIHPSTVTGCTVVDNEAGVGTAVYMVAANGLSVSNCILARNRGGAALTLVTGSSLTLSCSDVHGNAGGDGLPAGVVDNGGNFSLEPQFCGIPGSMNYYLQGDSPCAPGNHPDLAPCGLIGAKPTMCGMVPVNKKTWGQIKSLYGDAGK